jgi:RNA polymerase sigma-70 factor (ECF subfamily)
LVAISVENVGDPQLTAAVVAGDFERIFREFAPYVLRVLPRLGVAARDVDDVAQDVFWAVHRALPGFEGRSSLKTWVYGICIRTCGNYRNRAHRRHELLAQASEPSDVLVEIRTPASDLANRRALLALDAALSCLPEVQRAVFVLREVEALDVVEIADVLGCSKFTVYARLYAAQRSVRKRMGAHGTEASEHD